jgi:urease accessory protein UreE
LLRAEAELHQLQQVAARAAAHLNRAQFGKRGSRVPVQQGDEGALALLHGLPVLRSQRVVAAVQTGAARVALGDAFELVHLSASRKRCASTG